MNTTAEEIIKKISDLPREFQQAMREVNIGSIVQEIGKKYALHIDAIDTLFGDVQMFIIGITKPEDFENSLKNITGITAEQISQLSKDINEQVFKKIRELAQKKMEEKETEIELNYDKLEEIDTITDYEEKIQDNENDVLKKAGVIVSDGPQMTPDTTELLNRKDVASGIENPPEAKIYKLNIVESKLNAPQLSPNESTDHTIKNISSPSVSTTKKIDPYREMV